MRLSLEITSCHWKAFSQKKRCKPLESWDDVSKELFKGRIKSRYLDPIEAIQNYGGKEGEGFAIVTLQCALIEFMSGLEKGCVNHKGQSESLFVDALSSPDKLGIGLSKDNAKEFYKEVRCALLHAAHTEGGWKIRTHGSCAINFDKKVVDRDQLQTKLTSYVDEYTKRLKSCKETQKYFKRKFDVMSEQDQH